MASITSIAEIGSLVGDPARANMLIALKDSPVVSAGDLTRAAGIAPSTASGHLARLVDAGLVTVAKSGRHRYYRLSDPAVAELLEGIETLAGRLAPGGHPRLRHDQAVLHARPCTDHLAGRLGVQITEAILGRGLLRSSGGDLAVSGAGIAAFSQLGIDVANLECRPRTLIVLCRDWSEERVHLGGALGGAMFLSFLERDWMRRARGADVVTLTPKGRAGLRTLFGVEASLPAGA